MDDLLASTGPAGGLDEPRRPGREEVGPDDEAVDGNWQNGVRGEIRETRVRPGSTP
jgi:hypothetical protein